MSQSFISVYFFQVSLTFLIKDRIFSSLNPRYVIFKSVKAFILTASIFYDSSSQRQW